MTNIINQTPQPNINWPVDFSWQYALGSSIYSEEFENITLPFANTTVVSAAANGSTITSTPTDHHTVFSLTVTDASSFIGGNGRNLASTNYYPISGQYPHPIGYIYVFNSDTNWYRIGYTVGPTGEAAITSNTFNYCFILDGYTNGSSNPGCNLSITSGSPAYDPRWSSTLGVLEINSASIVTFSAIDPNNLGLPNSKKAKIINYHWDLSNGQIAEGPTVDGLYWFTGQLNYNGVTLAAPTEIKVTLTATDINGYIYIVTHPITFSQLYTNVGAPFVPNYMDTNITGTTIASGSNSIDVSTFTGAGVINVASTTAFTTAGKISIAMSVTSGGTTNYGNAIVSYTGKTSTTFTGCSITTSGTFTSGTLSTGETVSQVLA